MRRFAMPATAGLLFVGFSAQAGTFVETGNGDWGGYANFNINTGNDLDLVTIQVVEPGGDWYRHPWDGVYYAGELSQDDATWFDDRDRCVQVQAWSATDTTLVNGNRYRAGTWLFDDAGTDYEPTISSGAAIILPSGIDIVDEIRFLTGGGRNGTSTYVVRFTYADATTADVNVPILQDTTTGGTRTDTATSPDWDRYLWNGALFTSDAAIDANTDGLSDCKGNGSDEVHVFNPNPTKDVDEISFTYVDYATAGASPWLGGPLALTVVTDEPGYSATWIYDGYVDSGENTGLNAGGAATWHQISWNATFPGDDSTILIRLSCSATGGIGTFGNESVIDLGAQTSPYDIPSPCPGRYGRYIAELYAAVDQTPLLLDLTLTYDLDSDGDGYGAATDCNDANASIHPGAVEIIGDEVDQDCDGGEVCWLDGDDDGARSDTNTIASTDTTCVGTNEGRNADAIDCNDGNAAIKPGAAELPGDLVDQNCDNLETCYQDSDNDGYRHASNTTAAQADITCSGANQGVASDPIDCSDTNAAIHPGATELPGDLVDQDCDLLETCYQDVDNDTYRHATNTTAPQANLLCNGANQGALTDGIDCNDNNAAIKPGATEIAGDLVDQNCDNLETCYQDADNDGYRHATNTTAAQSDINCSGAFQAVATDPVDCDDNNAAVNGSGVEIVANGIDEDCDGFDDCYFDNDDDSYGSTTVFGSDNINCAVATNGSANSTDCNDNNAAVHPGATELVANGVDDNCDTQELCYADTDGDTYGSLGTVISANVSCTDAGESANSTDCNDANAQSYPGAPLGGAYVGDGVDRDCDGFEECYDDNDMDGFGTATIIDDDGDGICIATDGESTVSTDCNDASNTAYPGAPEVVADSIDQDCNGVDNCYQDADQDNFGGTTVIVGTTINCSALGESRVNTDCSDSDPERFPGNTETVGNGKDNDCNGIELCWADTDLDLQRSNTVTVNSVTDQDCLDPGEAAATATVDCDDNDATQFVGNTEIIGNGVDNDCSGTETCWADADLDGYRSDVNTVLSVVPDEDCTDLGEAMAAAGIDCNDAVATTNPAAPDLCGDGVDNDCDGNGDWATPGAGGYLDDDGDGLDWATEQGLGTSDCDDDFDNDGLTDDDEVALGTSPTNADTDGDGANDGVEVPNPAAPLNTDGDALIDALDTDDDGDGVLTTAENKNGINGPMDDDTDADGIPDFRDSDDDNDKVLTINEDVNVNGNWFDDDTDGDGVPNFRDRDDDGDGLNTDLEDVDGDGNPRDDNTDGDASADYLDSDDDNDGVLTKNEDRNNDGDVRNDDTDGDAIPNYRDNDDDGDGIPTLTENTAAAGTDVDLDGVPNYLDTDSDNDGWSDTFEGVTDTDLDGKPNYLDTDSDNDTVLDINELGNDTDLDGVTNRLDADDDGDGVPTALEDVNGNGNPASGDDTDADTISDYLDDDDDGDTIKTRNEDPNGNGNWFDDNIDGDTKPDFRDNDDDNDGLLTRYEDPNGNNDPLDDNTDGDAYPDYRDNDDDNDGVPTSVEDRNLDGDARNDNTDGDLLPNYRDPDDDNDGIPTATEIIQFSPDVDADGIPNDLDSDSDADGYTDLEETAIDSDGDGKPDFVDTDSDNDTVPDLVEVHGDTDGDLKKDRVDDDDDGDTIPTATEQSDLAGDADGIPNYLDTDSDNDGWPDSWEWTAAATPDKNQDGDAYEDYVDIDSDNDTVLDSAELGDIVSPGDTDNDGLENRLDSDDDGDTIPTALEDYNLTGSPIGDDWDGDGKDDYLDDDDDNDTVPTKFEDPNGNGNPLDDDTDGDGFKNFHDTDDDNDGVLTANESPDGDANPRNDDEDGDGALNYVDSDDDGDGIPTATENAAAQQDADGDGDPNYLDTDSDDDGWGDDHEWTVGPNRPDFDLDGVADYLDTDSDNDTVSDANEEGGANRPVATTDTDGDGNENRVDTDDDGDKVPTAQEQSQSLDGNPLNDDWDGDGIPDFRDADDDGDTVITFWEDVNNNGDPRDDDTDGDGVKNWLDVDDDGDGELTINENPNGIGDPRDDDTDGDLTPNYRDVDDDGDGIFTSAETAQWSRDADGDGIENHLDLDSDGDGWTDAHEWTVGPSRPDADLDTIPDFVDTDSDNDTILDSEEGSDASPTDTDGDGTENRVDPDDDGDGLPTAEEEWELADGNPRNDDYDNDGIPDYLDDDDDNDHVLTVIEDVLGTGDARDTDTDGDGIPNFLDTDDDNDTVPTLLEDPVYPFDPANIDTDGDGLPDYLDVDDDGDSILTINEVSPLGVGPIGWDFDGDYVWNYLDADDDNDGIETFCELSFGADHLRLDTDGDLIIDGDEWFNTLPAGVPLLDLLDRNGSLTGFDCLDPWDRDSDGTINALDQDDDGDGIVTFIEGTDDDDCAWPTAIRRADGIPNYLDYDSDNDTLLDDLFGDGIANGDGLGDVDGDFLPDFIDCDNSGCAGDSDQDGITNCDEAALCPDQVDTTNCSTDPDYDNDGVLDGDELGNIANPNDTDGDGILDPYDTDDDGDGVDTRDELGLECPSGEDWELLYDDLLGWVHWCPTDDVFLLDDFQNTDEDTGDPWPLEPDGIPDYLDEDDDGDGRPTLDEGDGDDDGDGIVNYLDPNDEDGPLGDPDQDGLDNATEELLGLDPNSEDSDRDGIPDDVEIGDPANPADNDGDNVIDALDADDDGDGIDTREEGASDTDGDGVPNYLDDDSDGDGIPDGAEASGDADCDGVPDRLDSIDDNLCGSGDSGVEVITWDGCDGCSNTGGTGGVAWVLGVGLVALRRRRAA